MHIPVASKLDETVRGSIIDIKVEDDEDIAYVRWSSTPDVVDRVPLTSVKFRNY